MRRRRALPRRRFGSASSRGLPALPPTQRAVLCIAVGVAPRSAFLGVARRVVRSSVNRGVGANSLPSVARDATAHYNAYLVLVDGARTNFEWFLTSTIDRRWSGGMSERRHSAIAFCHDGVRAYPASVPPNPLNACAPLRGAQRRHASSRRWTLEWLASHTHKRGYASGAPRSGRVERSNCSARFGHRCFGGNWEAGAV